MFHLPPVGKHVHAHQLWSDGLTSRLTSHLHILILMEERTPAFGKSKVQSTRHLTPHNKVTSIVYQSRDGKGGGDGVPLVANGKFKVGGAYSWRLFPITVGFSASIYQSFTMRKQKSARPQALADDTKCLIYTACTKELWKVFVSA